MAAIFDGVGRAAELSLPVTPRQELRSDLSATHPDPVCKSCARGLRQQDKQKLFRLDIMLL